MKVLLDTNVILDIVETRNPFYFNSYRVFSLAAKRVVDAIVGAGSITDIYYVNRKNCSDSKQALDSIVDLLEVIIPVDTKAEDIRTAINLGFSDFEDAVICATAMREKADYIITRNIDDFSTSPIKAVTPEQFLALPEYDREP
ncbi:DNA-binding protein [Spirochaetia bacterium]|nr:DNA-binding protein [Spirochaetia bacterium]